MTLDDIAEEADLSKGGVYWHFGSKKELFLALIESLSSNAEAIYLAFMTSQTNATNRLTSALDVFSACAAWEGYQAMVRLLTDIWAQNRQDPQVNELAMSIYRRYREPLIQLIEEGIASGEFKAVNPMALATILFAMYDGLAIQAMIISCTTTSRLPITRGPTSSSEPVYRLSPYNRPKLNVINSSQA